MKNNLLSYIDSFGDYLIYELNYSKKTALTYKQVLGDYYLFLDMVKVDFRQVDNKIANKYKAHLIASNYTNKTSSLHLSGVRSFYNYLVEINLVVDNPFFNIKNPKIEKKLPNFLNDSEATVMFDNENSYNEEEKLKYRNALIVEFLYATGIRVSELCQIKLSDINTSDYSLKVLGKGAKERIVYYKACNQEKFKEYLNKIRPAILMGVKSDYLFVSKSGKGLTTRSVELIVKKYAWQKDIKSKVTPHTMRHTYATDLLNNGADIRSVGELLGHESLSTTQIYTHVTSERLKSVYKNTHPRNKK